MYDANLWFIYMVTVVVVIIYSFIYIYICMRLIFILNIYIYFSVGAEKNYEYTSYRGRPTLLKTRRVIYTAHIGRTLSLKSETKYKKNRVQQWNWNGLVLFFYGATQLQVGCGNFVISRKNRCSPICEEMKSTIYINDAIITCTLTRCSKVEKIE